MVITRESDFLKTKDTWETLIRPVFYVKNRNRMRAVYEPLVGESGNDIW